MKLLVKGGHVVDPSTGLNQICDILIDNGRISAVGESLTTPEEHCSTLDASGLVVAPGLVDLHVHLREPGQEDKETIACLLYTSPSPRDISGSRMPSSA